jgi:hypothetical protein
MEVSGPLNALGALPLGKESSIPIEYEVGRAPEAVWTLWKKIKDLTPARNPTPLLQPIAIPTELARLTYLGVVKSILTDPFFFWWSHFTHNIVLSTHRWAYGLLYIIFNCTLLYL